eukprot:TRINITY_DN5100_c0_g1_i3.p1 TRINITY_DN5100_c0_g1~~TRINITY_DN5100_c0_g1_i3.p1  ORF type:complete len:131 (-),score=28.28 TRINITY_DN5100_c0_g1_i3:41-433(-)
MSGAREELSEVSPLEQATAAGVQSQKKLSPEERAAKDFVEQWDVCRKMFFIGFLALPWMWVVMAIHFRWTFYSKDPRSAPFRRNIYIGLTIALLEFIGYFVWAGIYVDNWYKWGATTDDWAAVLPKGEHE